MDGMKKFHSMYGQKSGSSLSSTKAAAGGRIATAKPPEPKYAAANRELAEKSPDLFFENWPAAERRSTPGEINLVGCLTLYLDILLTLS